MKTKWIPLLVLLLAAVLVFGACKKRPSNPQPAGGDPGDQTPASEGDGENEENQAPEGVKFVDQGNGFAVHIIGYPYQGEELVVSSVSPDNKIVTGVEDLGFYKSPNLKKVVLPEGLTIIGGQAFAECSSLTSVELPNSLEQIKLWAFEHCTSLTEITYNGTISAWNGILINSEWIDTGKTITIHCTNGDITATGA